MEKTSTFIAASYLAIDMRTAAFIAAFYLATYWRAHLDVFVCDSCRIASYA